MPFAVLCQIVCLNLVYFTFLVLDVLSAEIFISLPLRSCAFPSFCEKMCWPALCIWVIVFILIMWMPVERNWVVWHVLSLTTFCLCFIHSLSPPKFLHWSARISLETLWSWNRHAKSQPLKGMGIIIINKHTLPPNAKNLPVHQSSGRRKESPNTFLLFPGTYFWKQAPHTNIHTYYLLHIIFCSQLTPCWPHLFIQHNREWSWHLCANQWAKQARLCPQGATVWQESRESAINTIMGGGKGNAIGGGAIWFQEVMEIMLAEAIFKLRKERNGWRMLE